MRVYVDISRTDLYRAVGRRQNAAEAIARALATAHEASDRAAALFKEATVQLDNPHYAGLAEATFERFLESERRTPTQRPLFLTAALVNLAYIDRKAGKYDRALERMEEARQRGVSATTYRLNRGMILVDRGDLAEGISDLRAAEAAGLTGERSWAPAYQLALAYTKAGHLEEAIAACRRSIEKVSELAARSGMYGPTVIANLRQPHLHLIGIHARRRQWSEVLDVVTYIDTRSLLDSREAPTDLPEPPMTARRLGPPRRALGDKDAVMQAWRGRRLVIVVPGGDHVWRLVLRDGVLEGRDLGEAAPLEKLARQLEVDPDDPASAGAGRTLGEAMLGEVPADGTIDLLVVGPLARAPLASLRLGDRRAIDTVRVVRVPGVLPWKSRAGALEDSQRMVVLGDPSRDLAASAGEAIRIADRLGATRYLHAAATRAAFATARGAALLHVSAHAARDLDGPALVLADGRATVADIAGLAPGPRRVVLATCASAVGQDEVGSDSLANAFLEAGADLVVATRQTVDDGDAARLVAAFYDAGGAVDPVKGLAAAQSRLAGQLAAQTWSSFEVIANRPTPP
jgi:hypothetical protein